jgi:hypothetical protein
MQLQLTLTYDGATMDQLTRIVELQTNSDKPIRDNQRSKVFKELVLATLEKELQKTIQAKIQELSLDTLDILE